jgi:hypothetical protein
MLADSAFLCQFTVIIQLYVRMVRPQLAAVRLNAIQNDVKRFNISCRAAWRDDQKKREEHKTLLLKGRFGFWMQPPKAKQDRTKAYHSQSSIKARQFFSLIETYQICF